MSTILTTAILFLLPGAIVSADSQAPREQEKQPEKQQQQAKPAQQARPAQQQAKSPQQQSKPAQQAKSAQTAAPHGRIPDDKFRASFGSGHTFHVTGSDFSGASRRFQYGGYSWALINPWPVGWLYTDSVYVDYMNGGYFLCDPVHPGVYLSINIG